MKAGDRTLERPHLSDEAHRLREASLGRVYQHTVGTNIGFITASRNEYDPQVNRTRNAELQMAIRRAGYGYILVVGHFFENEEKPNEVGVDEQGFLATAKRATTRRPTPHSANCRHSTPRIGRSRKAALKSGK